MNDGVSLLSRVFHFIRGPNPVHPSVWEGRLSPMVFRRFDETDLNHCVELYSLNEKGRFPQGVIEQYRKSLAEQESYYLVSEMEGRIVASGGVSYWMRENMVVLCFGLVEPQHQGRGIGTALLLARLALLKPKPWNYHVMIFAVEKSFAFYRRFGFYDFTPWQDASGAKHPSGHLLLTEREIRRCRALLEAHNISVPQDENQIPLRTRPP
jgi:predicted N-acetyltransferase YhbS